MRISEEIHASCRLNKVKELQMRIAQAIHNRMTGSLHNRRRLAKCLSRVRGNLHARFGAGDSPRLPGVHSAKCLSYVQRSCRHCF